MKPDTTTPSTWPANILAATLFLVPAVGMPNEYVLQDTLKSAIAAFGILLATLAWLVDLRKNPRPIQLHWIVLLPLTLCLYALGSMVWSHAYLAGVEAVRWFLVGLVVLVAVNTLDETSLLRVLWGVHGGTYVASIWVALQFWAGWSFFPQAAPPASTFVNRNFFAEYAVSVLPLSLYLLLAQQYSRWLGVLVISMAFNVIAILMSGTRSALLAMAFVAPLLILAGFRFRARLACSTWSAIEAKKVAAVFIVAVAAMGMVPSGAPDADSHRTPFSVGSTRSASVSGALHGADNSFSTRLEMWKATARMSMAHPWFGVGAGAWEVQVPLYQRSNTPLEIDYYAHNDHLQVLAEYGLVVGGLTLAFLIAHVLMGIAGIARTPSPDSKHPGKAISGLFSISCLTLLIVANAGFPMHLAAGSCLLGLTLAVTARYDDRSPVWIWLAPRKSALPQIVLAGLAACIPLAGFITIRATYAEFKFVRALESYAQLTRTPKDHSDVIAFLHRRTVEDIFQGMAVAPHYRKLMSETGDTLVALGDWQNAAVVWESVATSRPHIPAVWSILAVAYARTQQHARAHEAWTQLQRLRPHDLGTKTLQIQLIHEGGNSQTARQMLREQLRVGEISHDMLQLAYVVGYQTQDLQLSIQAMETRNHHWPEQAADGHMRLGKLYADPLLNDHKKALEHFALGLQFIPEIERSDYLSQVPNDYRQLLDNRGNESSSSVLGAGHDTIRSSSTDIRSGVTRGDRLQIAQDSLAPCGGSSYRKTCRR